MPESGFPHGPATPLPASTADRWRPQPRWFPAEVLPAVLFLVLTLPLCVFLALATPVGQVADEAAHISKAMSLLGGQIVGRRAEVALPDGTRMRMSGVDVDMGPTVAAMIMRNEGGGQEVTRDLLDRARAVPWTGRRNFQAIGPIAGYFPVFYVAAAAGMQAARSSGAGPLQSVIAGRLANSVFYGALGMLALLFARRGRGLLFCALSVPMAVSLGGSLNQDGLMIATTVLAAALLSWGWERAGAAGRRAYFAAAFLLGCAILAKPPYLPLAVMLLLPLPRSWRFDAEFRARFWTTACIAGLTLAWMILVSMRTTAAVPTGPYVAGPLWPGAPGAVFNTADPALQLRTVQAHPWRVLTLPFSTIRAEDNLVWQMIGILGWLTVWLPDWLYRLWLAAAACAALADLFRPGGASDAGQRPGWIGAILLLLGGLACVEAVYLSQYLVWTQVGAERIDGPQGRYLLPLIPLVALALPRFGMRGAVLLRGALLAVPVLAAAADNVALPTVMLTLFHTP